MFLSIDVCSPVLPKEFNVNQPKTIRLYPLSNYTFGAKEQQPEEDPSVVARLKRLEEHYEKHGMRRTCEGILVCHEHNHPHILMLQIANAFFKLYVLLVVAYISPCYALSELGRLQLSIFLSIMSDSWKSISY